MYSKVILEKVIKKGSLSTHVSPPPTVSIPFYRFLPCWELYVEMVIAAERQGYGRVPVSKLRDAAVKRLSVIRVFGANEIRADGVVAVETAFPGRYRVAFDPL